MEARSQLVPNDEAELAGLLDGALQNVNIEYRSKRGSGRLGAVRVNLLSRGSLAALDRRILAQRGGRVEQYKHGFLYPRPGFERDFSEFCDSGLASGGTAGIM